MLVGPEMLEHFRNSTVAVIGVGGVGGYAAEMIVRAGIGHLIILDSDDVSVTNKNRQLLALDSTVGRPKCDVLAERLKDIAVVERRPLTEGRNMTMVLAPKELK